MQYKTHYTYQAVTSLLHTTPNLQKFVNKLEQLKHISQYVTNHLEPDLANHCRVANLRDGALVLSTTSPAWHHKLRFVTMDLLSTLRTNPMWSGLKSIEVRVDYLPSNYDDTPTNFKTPSPISAQNAKLLRQTATHIRNQKLAEAITRLAKHSNT